MNTKMYNQPSYARQAMPHTYTAAPSYRAFSPIEAMAYSAAPIYTKTTTPANHTPTINYSPQTNTVATSPTYTQNFQNYFQKQTAMEQHATAPFLAMYRPQTQFVDSAEDIEDIVKETFEKTTGRELPQNIMIHILDKEEMKELHERNGGMWSEGIQGFSINKQPYKMVVVKKADLDQVMLVLGHEIGHVLTPTAATAHDEEAKAFAFEIAWAKAIKEHNIADLNANINVTMTPAQNGLHNVAFAFIQETVAQGKEALETYWQLAKRKITMAA